MTKIIGKFAPLTQELGEDDRFIVESTDLDKLLYVLIIYTCHMTNHQAPVDPRFYKIRFGLRSKHGQIAASLRRIRDRWPRLSWGEKSLSLLNSVTYKNQNSFRIEKNKNKKESNDFQSHFEVLWKKYPKPIGKKKALKSFNASVKSQKDLDSIRIALENYLSSKRVSDGFIQNGATWFNNWADWVEYKEKSCLKCKNTGKFTSTTGYEITCECPAGAKVHVKA